MWSGRVRVWAGAGVGGGGPLPLPYLRSPSAMEGLTTVVLSSVEAADFLDRRLNVFTPFVILHPGKRDIAKQNIVISNIIINIDNSSNIANKKNKNNNTPTTSTIYETEAEVGPTAGD